MVARRKDLLQIQMTRPSLCTSVTERVYTPNERAGHRAHDFEHLWSSNPEANERQSGFRNLRLRC